MGDMEQRILKAIKDWELRLDEKVKNIERKLDVILDERITKIERKLDVSLQHMFMHEANKLFQTARRQYEGPGFQACGDLLRWGKLHFPMVKQEEISVHLVLWDDAMHAFCNVVPNFKTARNGVYQPPVDQVAKAMQALYNVDAPGSCVWVKEPSPSVFGTVNVYKHKCVRIADALLLDWGYDQFTLPANVSLRLCQI